MSYFAVERNGRYGEIVYSESKDVSNCLPDFMKMSYDEMKSNEYLDAFVVAIMNDVNEMFGDIDETTVVTLIGDDDIFIWGILMDSDENDAIRYTLIDWKKHGKNYRYPPEKST